jgi:copper chaperone CopZ
VLSVHVNLNEGEVTVETRAGKVKAEQLIEAVNNARDSAHSFKAKLKKGPKDQ